jgi:RecA/RadA recombinase
MSDIEYIKSIMTKRRESSMFKSQGFLSSGSTLLNLACTGTIDGAWPVGAYSLIIGDSHAGKTWLAWCAFAEACADERFDDHRLIYDGPEGGAMMDIQKFFGERLFKRIESPSYDDDGVPQFSESVEEFYYMLDDLLRAGEKLVYAIDSMDCLSSKVEAAKIKEMKTAFRKGRETKGIMTDGKAKANSGNLRNVIPLLKETGSVLLVLCQTRDNLNSMFATKTHAGGRALKFYSAIEIWLAIKKHYKQNVRGKPRETGICSNMKVAKSRITGKMLSVDVPILHGSGLDDVGSCIDYLIDESEWTKSGKSVGVGGFIKEFKGGRSKLIQTIEEMDKEEDLRLLVGKVWKKIEDAMSTKRKRKYT